MRLPGWEDTAAVLFWPGSELDIRGPEVQTCQIYHDHKENRLSLLHINCQRYSHQQKKDTIFLISIKFLHIVLYSISAYFFFPLPSFLVSIKVIFLCHPSSDSLVSRRQDFAATGHSLLADKVKKKILSQIISSCLGTPIIRIARESAMAVMLRSCWLIAFDNCK